LDFVSVEVPEQTAESKIAHEQGESHLVPWRCFALTEVGDPT
jgi:hypothetical protein